MMAAPKIETKTPDEPVKVVPVNEEKRPDPTAHITPETVVESVAQFIDEFDPATALQLMQQHIRMSEEVRRNGGGRWEMPTSHRHIQPNGPGRTHRLTRLGCMADVRQRDKILRQQFLLEQQGWKLAPKGTRNSLYIIDGDQGVYMIIAEMVGRVQDEFERKTRDEINKRRFSRSVGNLPEDIAAAGIKNVAFERVDVSQGRSSIEDFRRMK